MKTFDEVQAETETFGDVFLSTDFKLAVEAGDFIPYDGMGYFHDGENETDYCVWAVEDEAEFDKYPYVIWYNR